LLTDCGSQRGRKAKEEANWNNLNGVNSTQKAVKNQNNIS